MQPQVCAVSDVCGQHRMRPQNYGVLKVRDSLLWRQLLSEVTSDDLRRRATIAELGYAITLVLISTLKEEKHSPSMGTGRPSNLPLPVSSH